MSELKTNVKMLEKHLTEMLGREVMVSNIQNYQLDGADVHIIKVLYHIDEKSAGTGGAAGRVGYGMDRTRYGVDREHTVAVLIDESMTLPDFSLRSLAGINVPVRDRYGPRRRLEFSDVGEFDKNQKLRCWNPEACRFFFSKDLRKKLAAKRGLTIFGSGGKLAVFFGDGVCLDRNLDSFIEDANEGLSRFKAAECFIREKHDYSPSTEVHHLLDSFSKEHGIRQFTRGIEARHLDALEASKVPREIPKVIRSKVLAFSWIPFFSSFVLLPLTLVIPQIAMDGDGQRIANVASLLGSSVCVAVMGGLLYCRSRIMRTLKSGEVYQAVMINMHETSLIVGSQRSFQVTVEFMVGDEKQSGVTRVYNLSVSLARVYCRTRKAVRILVHPTNPNYILCLEMIPGGLDW